MEKKNDAQSIATEIALKFLDELGGEKLVKNSIVLSRMMKEESSRVGESYLEEVYYSFIIGLILPVGVVLVLYAFALRLGNEQVLDMYHKALILVIFFNLIRVWYLKIRYGLYEYIEARAEQKDLDNSILDLDTIVFVGDRAGGSTFRVPSVEPLRSNSMGNVAESMSPAAYETSFSADGKDYILDFFSVISVDGELLGFWVDFKEQN